MPQREAAPPSSRRRLAPKAGTHPAVFATLKTRHATLRFVRGDCLNVLPTLPAGGVDAIVTSPPYNLGVRYSTYNDQLPREEVALQRLPFRGLCVFCG